MKWRGEAQRIACEQQPSSLVSPGGKREITDETSAALDTPARGARRIRSASDVADAVSRIYTECTRQLRSIVETGIGNGDEGTVQELTSGWRSKESSGSLGVSRAPSAMFASDQTCDGLAQPALGSQHAAASVDGVGLTIEVPDAG